MPTPRSTHRCRPAPAKRSSLPQVAALEPGPADRAQPNTSALRKTEPFAGLAAGSVNSPAPASAWHGRASRPGPVRAAVAPKTTALLRTLWRARIRCCTTTTLIDRWADQQPLDPRPAPSASAAPTAGTALAANPAVPAAPTTRSRS